MATTPLITIKNWFKTGLKPTQIQFWETWDSFWHKDDKIPSATIDGLQALLDGKMDKKAITATVKAAPYVAGQAYVFDALVPEYVSFSNPQSANPDYQAFGWYLLLADASGSDTPEVAPAKWQYIGRQLGDITIEDVFELRKELDDLNAKIPTVETVDVNTMAEYVPGNVYEGGDTYVSYVNLESLNEQFQSPAIYRAVVDALAGQTPETHPYDPETGEGIWWYLGDTVTLGSRVTCRTSVMSVSELMLIEGAQDRDVCGVIGLIESIEDVYTYYQNATTGVKPANIAASDPGRWVLTTVRPIAPRYIPYALQLSSTQLVTHQGKLHYFKSLTGRTAFTFNLYQHTSMLDNGLRPAYSIIIDNRDNASNMAFTLGISSGTLIWGASGSVASVAAGKVLRIEVVATKVSGAYVYYAMHDAGGGGTIAIDAVPTAGSTNAVQSGGVKTELDQKANKITNPTQNRLLTSGSDGHPVESSFRDDQVVQVGSIVMSDINVGEKKIMVVEKQPDGSAAFGGAIGLLDVIGNPNLSALLAETAAGWVGDEITLTGDNRSGELGENSQFYELESDFFLCKSHSNGTTSTNGWAVWKRNRGTDSLISTITAHATIITQLELETGWSSSQFKTINAKSKRGTWFRRPEGGYLYMCINDANGWTRIGTPQTVNIEITSLSHPILTASLTANDWATNPFYLEKTNATDETASQGQEWWDIGNKKAYKRNMDGYWLKMN